MVVLREQNRSGWQRNYVGYHLRCRVHLLLSLLFIANCLQAPRSCAMLPKETMVNAWR